MLAITFEQFVNMGKIFHLCYTHRPIGDKSRIWGAKRSFEYHIPFKRNCENTEITLLSDCNTKRLPIPSLKLHNYDIRIIILSKESPTELKL